MKKAIYLTLTLLTIVSCSKSTIDELPIPSEEQVVILDNNFEKRLIELGIDSDGSINHLILKSDAEKVTKLSLYNEGINSLAGIESFTNLKRLYADANYLTNVDLSNNILLDTISLTANDLTNIKGIDKAKSLVWLSLSYNYFTEFTLDNDNVKNFLMDHNDLVSLEISNAPKLESAKLNINKIQSLDFSNSPLLKVLIFSANKVKSINFDNNPNLE